MIKWLENFLARRRDFMLVLLDKKHEHELELRVCQSCETLKAQLEFQNQLIRELTQPVPVPVEINSEKFEPMAPKHIPWSVTRSKLEKADRELASRLRTQKTEQVTADNLDEELKSIKNG